MDLKNLKVGVLGGGVSGERAVSLESANGAYRALERKGIKAVLVDITTDDHSKVKKIIADIGIDLAFIALHGEFGEDGKIQSILEELSLPYTGSDPKASYDAMDKIASKEIFVAHSISTPRYTIYLGKEVAMPGDYPVVVKPYFSGSSLGVWVVDGPAQLQNALDDAISYKGHKVLVEEYIDGRELTVGILDDAPLEIVEIVPRKGFYDFNNKYSDGMTDFLAPAPLEDPIRAKLKKLALAAHKALGCRHFSRIDIRLNSVNVPCG